MRHSFSMSLDEFRLANRIGDTALAREEYAKSGEAHYAKIRDIPVPSEFKTKAAYEDASREYWSQP